MTSSRLPSSRVLLAGAALIATLGLSACADDGYGYGGIGAGYGPAYYGDPLYDGGYYGWYGDSYYPGSGYYVYDRDHNQRQWNHHERRYWHERGRGYTGAHAPNPMWDRFQNRPPAGARVGLPPLRGRRH